MPLSQILAIHEAHKPRFLKCIQMVGDSSGATHYTTTFVHRPDGEQIDEIGIAPDLERSSPVDEEAFAAEVAFAQAFLERPAATQARQSKPTSRRPR